MAGHIKVVLDGCIHAGFAASREVDPCPISLHPTEQWIRSPNVVENRAILQIWPGVVAFDNLRRLSSWAEVKRLVSWIARTVTIHTSLPLVTLLIRPTFFSPLAFAVEAWPAAFDDCAFIDAFALIAQLERFTIGVGLAVIEGWARRGCWFCWDWLVVNAGAIGNSDDVCRLAGLACEGGASPCSVFFQGAEFGVVDGNKEVWAVIK